MKTLYLIAFASLVILVAASVSAYAGADDYANDGIRVYQYNPTTIEGRGPGPYAVQPQYTLTPIPEACCEVAPPTCGAFCEAGQVTPGWPYNWCDEYWLRPDSNF